jgi:enamine deaminase RidA (YjgF/YER057c/UK114 family)
MRNWRKARIKFLLAGTLFFTFAAHAQIRPIVPSSASAPTNRFYTPGIDAGDYVYISGQGPRRPDGTLPANFADQVRQALNNVKLVVEASGLTMDHVVYTQIYLEDISKSDEVNRILSDAFDGPTGKGNRPPARATLGVAKLPDAPVLINAVAVRSMAEVRSIDPPSFKSNEPAPAAVLTHDRLFVSAMPGSDPATGKVPDDPAAQVDFALDRMKTVLEAAGLDLRNMVFVNPYLTSAIPSQVMNQHYAKRFEFGNTPARATIQVSSLPGGAQIEYTGVAVRDLSKRQAVRPKNMPPSPTASPCVFAGDTLYCSAKSGFIPGPHGGVYASSTTHQLRQTMRNLLDNLEEAGLNFEQVVSTTVYLDDLSDLQSFDPVYGQYFTLMPSRTTVQQIAPAERHADKDDHYPDLEQISLIAIRSPSK